MTEKGRGACNNQHSNLSSYFLSVMTKGKPWPAALLICRTRSVAWSDQGAQQGRNLPTRVGFKPQTQNLTALELVLLLALERETDL